MAVIEANTCIRFVPKNSGDRIVFKDGYGCSSCVGRQGGPQYITLQKSACLDRGAIQHELIHALGFTHMQNHAKRDQYITVFYSNIQSDQRNNFDKTDGTFTNFDTPYDYFSVMHYALDAFAINNNYYTMYPTIEGVQVDAIGNKDCISVDDARRLNRMYDCENVALN